MKCPKCAENFTGVPDEHGFYVCPKCSAKLRGRTAAAAMGAGAQAAAPAASLPSPAPPATDPGATLPPGTPLKPIPRPGEPPATLEAVLAEVRVVRRSQEQILALLRARPSQAPAAHQGGDGDAAAAQDPFALGPAASVRARRRKTVLLADDQEDSRQAALSALETAQVPTRAVSDGNACIAAIAAEKPDVIVMELDIGGSLAGKDVVNMIKATMEWVDIPIVLYTRLPIQSQKEARTIHGADELVLKGNGSAETLVARVIAIFRKG
jgi:two-component system cell cycle response regulator DivK